MRRLITAGSALLLATGVVLVLPVTGPSQAEPAPVPTSVHEVAMGSVSDPAPDAVVEPPSTDRDPDPTTEGGDGSVAEPASAATLRVMRPDVPDFSLVGVTWAHDPEVVDVIVRIRTRDDAGTWSDWTEIGVEDAAPDGRGEPGRRGGTEPLWTGESHGIEVEVTTPSGASPSDVRLDLVDPGDSPADEVPGRPDIQDTADAAVTMPDVYSRAQWGADERLRTWNPSYAGTIKAATIHHTAGANGYAAGDVARIVRGIYHYHAVSLGWGDIGYNVLADRFGRLWEGRYGGLASTVVGAHAGGFNTYTFGVSMIGNYDVVDTTPEMIRSIGEIVGWKFSLYGVDPLGSVTLTSSGGGTSRYAKGQKVTLPTVFAHRQVGSTSCPGSYGFAKMDQIRQMAAGNYVDVTAISDRYASDEGLRAVLGSVVTSPALTADGSGAVAHYTSGSLYYSRTTGVRLVRGPVGAQWSSTGGHRGKLGYPTTDVAPTSDGVGESGRFQGGSIYWSEATGARVLTGPIERLWRSTGAERGVLGYPTHGVAAHGDGRGQFAHFQGGTILWSAATGARALLGPVRDAWRSTGGTTGPLGYPTQSVGLAPDGQGHFARFEGGSVHWSRDTGARVLQGPVEQLWWQSGATTGPLGYPTTSVSTTSDGVGQVADFQGGAIYWSSGTAARSLLEGPVLQAWRAAGAERSELGYPTQSSATAAGGGTYAVFQNGSIHSSPDTGTRTLLNPINAFWRSTGGVRGPLAYPTSDSVPTADGTGRSATFQGGAVYWSATTGARAVLGPVLEAWTAAGAEAGALGWPTHSVGRTRDGAGHVGRFQRGSIWWSPDTGAHALTWQVEWAWNASGAELGPLGYPQQGVTATQDGVGRFARFEGGSVWYSPRTGSRAMSGPVEAAWLSTGAERGALGYPTHGTAPTRDGVGRFARLQGGDIYWSPATGARILSGPVLTFWRAAGAERGQLGYPTASLARTADGVGRHAAFQGGTVIWSPTAGAHSVRGDFLTVWNRWGRAAGRLGYPTSEAYAVAGGTWQDFQHGTIRRSTATGRTWVQLG